MASRKENLKALFTNTRSRVIILFTAVLLVIAVLIGVIRFTATTSQDDLSGTQVTGAPGIQSIPGTINPTAQYAALQAKQNVQQAQQAAKTGGSAIPTIIRTQAFGEGVQSVGPQGGTGGVGFSTLALENTLGAQKEQWLQSLKDANCSKEAVQQVVQEGATISLLKEACTCLQLKNNGFQLTDLRTVCSCKALKSIGYNARDMKEAGYTAGQLRACDFNACQVRGAGYTAQEMKDGGFSDGELKGAGFSDDEIARASGLPDGVTAADVRRAGCAPEALAKLRAAGVTASAIRRINGCSAAQLKAAGYTAKELKDAGFSAADLKNAGFTPEELKAAGYSARDLLNAGFTPAELAKAGYTPSQIDAAENALPPGMSFKDIKAAGCSAEALKRERLSGVSAKAIRRYAGCTAAQLKAAGFTAKDLANAGFTPEDIKAASPLVSDDAIRAAGCNVQQLKALRAQGVSAGRIHRLNGCSAAQLKAAGYTARELADAGFTPEALAGAGFSPSEINAAEKASKAAILAAGCDAKKLSALRKRGVSAKRIRQLNGCTDAQLKAAGFTPEEIGAAGVSDDAIRSAGCDPQQLSALRQKGVSARRIRDLNGCSAAQLKAAGYTAKELADAGFTPQELLDAGFSPEDLSAAGLNPSGVIAAGRTADCSVASLKAAHAMGVSAKTIKDTLGCSAKALKAAGYTAAELKNAGFTAAELKDAGFTAKQLKDAGFTAKELRDAGFSAAALKAAGFSAKALRDAGFSAAELKKAGFTAAQLKAAGFSAKALKDAGFSADELRAAGFSAKALKDAGFSAAELKQAGFSDQALEDAGVLSEDSEVAGLDKPDKPADQKSAVTSMPGIAGPDFGPRQQAQTTQQLQDILKRQQSQMADQQFQQKLQQRTGQMLSTASQLLQTWKKVPQQNYVKGNAPKAVSGSNNTANQATRGPQNSELEPVGSPNQTAKSQKALIKTGDIMFAVLDTSVNSDEPGPILATIVTGRFKGAKLIGNFNLPSNADKMVISFNTMSVPSAPKTTSISAYAIDPNTARTALASYTNHHYLMRYGSLFASSFLEGFGNAFQSANTTVTIGGTGGVQSTTVESGIGRSIMENAVIGLATLGKTWGQKAQQLFNTPTTVQVCAGTGIGVLFTQDITSL